MVKKKNTFVKCEEDQDEVFGREYDEIDARDLEAIYQRYTDELETRARGVFQNILQDGMYVRIIHSRCTELTYFGLFWKKRLLLKQQPVISMKNLLSATLTLTPSLWSITLTKASLRARIRRGPLQT